MKFTVNRKIMLEYLKSMVRVAPKSSPVEELTGFLIEANEDDGYLYLTANNLEAAIQRKFKPQVESGGTFVMNAKTLMDILSLLGGTEVVFDEVKHGLINIKSENCVYTMPVLDGRRYPRPEMPFPEDTVKVSGMKQLYAKTNAVVSKGETSSVLTGIHVDITPKGIRAIGCDGRGVAIASREMKCDGTLSFTLPKQTLSYLAAAVGNDDELEIGIDGPFVVFMKEGMLFSTRKLTSEYVNVDMLVNSVKPAYTAKVEFDEFKNEVTQICDIASMGSVTSYVTLTFREDKIEMSTQNDMGGGNGSISSVMVDGTVGQSFSYPANLLQNLFKTVEGAMILQLDKRGYLLVMDRYNKYMTTPVTEHALQQQRGKYEEQRSKRMKKAKEANPTKTENRAA